MGGSAVSVGDSSVVFHFSDPALEASARQAVARELGPQVDASVPADLAAAYDELRSPVTDLVYGSRCYESGEAPRGRASLEALRRAGRFDLIGNVARGMNPTARVYAAEAILDHGALSAADAQTIAKIRALKTSIAACSGCNTRDESADALQPVRTPVGPRNAHNGRYVTHRLLAGTI